MSRPALIRSNVHPYYVTSKLLNEEMFPITLEEVWKIMVTVLAHTHKEHDLAIHGFVLMKNHFHLLCHTPKANLDQAMHAFLRSTSARINARSHRSSSLWEARYRWSLIESQTYYDQIYRYIFQRPVRADLVRKVEAYPYSTLLTDVPFPLFSSSSYKGLSKKIEWLNEKTSSEEEDLIKLGLKKALFDINKKKMKLFLKLNRPHPSDE